MRRWNSQTICKRGLRWFSVFAAHAIVLAAAFLLVTNPAPAQTPAGQIAPLRFEVDSVKPSASMVEQSKISTTTPGRFIATNVPLRFLILHAYNLREHELVDAPNWTRDVAFEVIGAYAPDRHPTDPEIRAMLRTLLQERFGLKLHREKRDLSAYTLVLANKDKHLGAWLRPSSMDCTAWLAEERPRTSAGGPSPVSPTGRRPACMMMATRRFLTGGTRTMAELATTLQSMTGRPVIDRTGLTGAWDIDLKWASMELKAEGTSGASEPENGPSLFTALQEQLGLKLVARKERFDVFIVDSVNRPAAN